MCCVTLRLPKEIAYSIKSYKESTAILWNSSYEKEVDEYVNKWKMYHIRKCDNL